MSPLCIFPYQAAHLVMKISYYHVLPLYCTKHGGGHDSGKFLVSCPPPLSPCIEGMQWVWRGHINTCVTNSEKLGVQYGPTAVGWRSVLHPQFQRMRFTLSIRPSQTHRIYIVINKLKLAISSLNSWTELLATCIFQFTWFSYILCFNSKTYFHKSFFCLWFPYV